MIKYFLPFVLIACGTKAADDTSEVDFDTAEEDSDSDPDIVEPPVQELTPTAVFVDFRVAITDSINIGTVTDSTGAAASGFFAIYLADYENWEGAEDYENACVIIHEISRDAATFADNFVNAGAWTGWTFSGTDTFSQLSPSCDTLSTAYAPLVTKWSDGEFGVGFGPCREFNATTGASCSGTSGDPNSPTFEDVIAGYPEDQVGTWAEDWAPYIHEAWITIDGISDPYAINYARSYAINEDGTMATANADGEADPDGQYLLQQTILDEAGQQNTYAIDGWYTTIPWGGLNPDYFLQ